MPVGVGVACLVHRHPVRPCAVGEPFPARAVEPHPVQIAADGIVGVRAVIDPASLLVDPNNSLDFALALTLGEDRLQASTLPMAINPPQPVALGGPQKPFAVLQERQIIGDVDPMPVTLGEQRGDLPVENIGQDHLEFRLRPVQKLHRHLPVIRPLYARNVFLSLVDPHDPRRGLGVWLGLDNADPRARVRIAGLGIALVVHGRLHAQQIRDRVTRDLGLIQFEKRNPAAVGRPMVAAAQGEFLRIHPVEITVQNQIRRPKCQLPRFPAARRHKPQIVFVNKRNPASVRRKAWVPNALFVGRERSRPLPRHIV